MTTNDGKPLNIPLDVSDSEDVMKMIQNLSSKKYENNSLCRVKLLVDYNDERLLINFTEHLGDSTLKDKEVRINGDVFVSDDQNIVFIHILEYACADNECEKEFIINHINWFIEPDYTELQGKLAPLILGDGEKPGQCFYGNTAQECSSKQCGAIIGHTTDTDFVGTLLCINENGTQHVGFHFEAGFDLNFTQLSRQYNFRCGYDKCNNLSVLQNVLDIFQEEYNLILVLKAFGYGSNRGGEEPETTISSTKSSTSSSSQQKTNTVQSNTDTTSVTTTATTTATTSVTTTATTSVTTTATTTATTSVRMTVTNSYINKTITTIGGTTTKANNGMHVQSTNAIIYVGLIIFMSRLIVLA